MANLIVLRSYNAKRQTPVRVSPLQDHTGKLYTGQGERGYYELLTEEEKKKLPVVVDHFRVKTLMNGTVLDLDDPIDAIDWKWMQKHPYIDLNRQLSNKGRSAVFYVEDEQRDSEMKVKTDRMITVAKGKMYEASQSKLQLAAKALGNPGAEHMTIERLQAWLAQQLEEHIVSPEAVINVLDPKQSKETSARALFQDMLSAEIIRRFGAMYKHGGQDGVPLGGSEEEVVRFLTDSKNEETVAIMMNKLEERVGV